MISLAVSTSKNGGAGGVTTDPIDTTGVDLLLVALGNWNSTGTLTDSKSNTWTALTPRGGAGARSRIYYCLNPTVGAGHTFSISITNPSLCVAGFRGVAAFDQESGSSSSSPGAITPSERNELLVSGVCWYPSGTVSISGGFSIVDQVDYSSGNGMGCALAWKIASAVQSPTWTVPGGGEVISSMASFEAADDPPAPATRPEMMLMLASY